MAQGLRFYFLGTPRAEFEGRPLPLNFRPRTLPLLAYVLLSPARSADVREIANNLWPDELDEDALANVRRHVYYLRRWFETLGLGPEGMTRSGRTIAVAPGIAAWIDVAEFERLARNPETRNRAIELYGGDLLEGFEDEWIGARRDSLRTQYLAALDAQIAAAIERSDPKAGIPLARKGLAADPWREDFMRALMRLLVLSGDRAGALKEYQEFVRILHDELNTEPSETTIDLAESIFAQQAVPRYAIPRAITSFVGRGRELERLEELVLSERLVTITGTAGVGKTRLAAELARRLERRFADGVRFIELSSIQDPRALYRTIQLSLAQDDAIVPGDTAAFEASLHEREHLIVLDNCEHVVNAACDAAQRLLAAAPRSRILCTSRIPFGVTGEAAWRLAPLSLDEDAAQLFFERARAARPSMNAGALSPKDLHRVCAAVDGIPLAIELAAARLRTMPLRQVTEQLEARSGAMAQALRWSMDLLSGDEHRVFERLSVFRQGFTADAAAAVCGVPVSEILARLVDLSLIVPPDPEADEERYRMLESVRQVASDALERSGETPAARTAHAAYYGRIFVALNDDLRNARARLYYSLVERDYDNVRAALEWTVSGAHDVEAGMRLALAVSRFWFDRGLSAEGVRWMHEALERPCADALLRAHVFGALATVSRNSGDYAQSFDLLAQSIEQLREGGAQPETIGKALATQSNAARMLGRFEAAHVLAREALQIFTGTGDRYLIAFARTCVAGNYYGEGRLEDAEREFMAILDEFERCGAENDAVLILGNLGICRLYMGDYERAMARLGSALARATAVQYRYCESWIRLGLALGYALMRDAGPARREIAHAAHLARTIDDKELQINCLEAGALIALDGSAQSAARYLACAERARERYNVLRAPVETPLYDSTKASIENALGSSAFRVASEEGRFAPLESELAHLESMAGMELV